ncbi:mitochondrial 18 KDa protein-domain-containing protein [Gaertneriomyces semiglobifer]|nr:mitochondrial 18 KDa protein-domain-containing protein [Gaertneriomyces semiglobifer]
MSGSSTQTIVETVENAVESYPAAQHPVADILNDPQHVETTETPARFLAYGARLRTLAVVGSRYLAYTSDVGEAFRPIISKGLVNAGYAVSFAYVGFDIAFETRKAYLRGASSMELTRTATERATFQGLASLALPAITIHTVVDVVGKMLKSRPKTTFVRWAPTLSGLAVVPLLPIMYDHPLEHAIAKGFNRFWPLEKSDTKKE